jgi:hypothetical protein
MAEDNKVHLKDYLDYLDYLDSRLKASEEHQLSLVIGMRDVIFAKIEALQCYLDAVVDALKEATTVAKDSMEHRLDNMNGFRDSLRDQATRMVFKEQYDSDMKQLRRELDEVKKYGHVDEGREQQRTSDSSIIFAIIAVVISVIGIIIKV